MTKEVIRPPEIVEYIGPVVFLAGPIQGAPDWQNEAAGLIHSYDENLIVASPRKDYHPGEFIYERQVDWETNYLNRASEWGAVLFWLALQAEDTPGRSYAQTSRFELGEWKVRHQVNATKLVVGIEEGFGNERYIRRRFSQDCPNVPILSSLPDTCRTAVDLLN
jgi:hypothetical protein